MVEKMTNEDGDAKVLVIAETSKVLHLGVGECLWANEQETKALDSRLEIFIYWLEQSA